MASLTAELYDDTNSSLVASLTESFDRRFQDTVSEVGSGTLSVLLNNANAAALTIGRHVRFLIDDEPVFTFRIDRRDVTRVSSREDVDQVVVVSGRGIVADWNDAVVYPRGGVGARPQSDLRPFTWASPELSDAGWPNAVAQRDDAVLEQTIGSYADFSAWWPPLGWPAPTQSSSCRWVWSRAATTTHPPGYSLFRTTVSVASSAVFLACVTGGGRARLFIDGIEVVGWTSSNPTWSNGETYRCVLPITAGSHVVAVEAENFDYSQTQYRNTPGSPGVVLAALHTLPATGGSFGTSTLVTGTSTAWKCLDYPEPYPAPSPYSILDQLLDEAQARGALSGWSLGGSISATTDALGVPWAAARDVTPSVGDTYLSVLKAMVDLELIDFRADPVGRVLWVWNHGTEFASSGVTLAAGVNVTELVHNAEVV